MCRGGMESLSSCFAHWNKHEFVWRTINAYQVGYAELLIWHGALSPFARLGRACSFISSKLCSLLFMIGLWSGDLRTSLFGESPRKCEISGLPIIAVFIRRVDVLLLKKAVLLLCGIETSDTVTSHSFLSIFKPVRKCCNISLHKTLGATVTLGNLMLTPVQGQKAGLY